MDNKFKNIKISKEHHEILKQYCEKKGLKIFKVIENLIDENCKPKPPKKDIYGEV